jgi:hypothetical protein
MSKRAELEMIGFDVGNDPVKNGQIALRWKKLTYDENGVLLAADYHRTVIDVDTDLDATLGAVYDDLERQGFGRPPATDRGYIDDATKRAWTPEVRSAVALDRIAKAEREATAKAEREAAEAAVKAKQAEDFKRMLREAGVTGV